MFENCLRAGLVGLLLGAAPAGVADAEQRVTLGWGRMFHNDALGDGHDRWQTGGYALSMVRGYSFNGSLPSRPGEVLEWRLAANIIAPADLQKPGPDDRRYAGTLSLGLHSQWQWQTAEIAFGADLVATGPQTGIGSFQRWAHKRLGMDEPQVLDDQIGNGLHPTLVAETGRRMSFGPAELRPFAELRAGAESLVRVGADLTFGHFGPGDLMIRDAVTGQRYRGVAGDLHPGFTFTLGADIARVFDSAFLPGGEAATLADDRSRLRAGIQWQGQRHSVFYGVTWLSKEFEEQPEGQVVGALSLNLRF
jgi:hypothetical protein